jgi:hypothetical protein
MKSKNNKENNKIAKTKGLDEIFDIQIFDIPHRNIVVTKEKLASEISCKNLSMIQQLDKKLWFF